MFAKKLTNIAEQVVSEALAKDIKLATIESCTGGMISALITDISGASKVYEGGLSTYSNQAKEELAHVPKKLLMQHGAVSHETAKAMASGALLSIKTADISIATTGIAGPTGATKNKPVGLVYFGLSHRKGEVKSYRKIFPGNRQQVREAAAFYALTLLHEHILNL